MGRFFVSWFRKIVSLWSIRGHHNLIYKDICLIGTSNFSGETRSEGFRHVSLFVFPGRCSIKDSKTILHELELQIANPDAKKNEFP